ncbi:branched-chain amino acid ABC transporter permease [Variovorax sp. JS1663]|uniref:branched-chain amino acid ABC transporter permease n=1 Tax=Variovorax sp. JS1663 TaxID=1851577 RepID=UPI000B343DE3|nr:branched-chain amino acid ABC transporter permease [Variovorax sp. JS1663]OUL99578.1 ABC transporter permease [Variovorax sp. JS1663]
MDSTISLILAQDGISTGAIYALLAVALVLVFAVTRIIFIPQGDLVAWGAMTIAALQAGHRPATVHLLLALGFAAFAIDGLRPQPSGSSRLRPLVRASRHLAVPLAAAAVAWCMPLRDMGLALQVALTLVIVGAMGPLLYRLVYRPVARQSVLLLLIMSVALHFAMMGMGLAMFGPEGVRSNALVAGSFDLGAGPVSRQSIAVVASSALIMVLLWFFFDRTLEGKAMAATAVNPVGARLMGIEVTKAGGISLGLASCMAAASGILIGPTTTIYYDSGFVIGLKGFVAAILGGLCSYPVAAAGALLVGLLEIFASFAASAYTEVLVFSLVLPVLLWRSIATHAHDGRDA